MKLFEVTYRRNDWSSETGTLRVVAAGIISGIQKAITVAKRRNSSARVVTVNEVFDQVEVAK